MYANNRDDYGKALRPVPDTYEAPVFNFNKLSFPSEVNNTAVQLQDWQKKLDMDSFIFEYYAFGMTNQIRYARVLAEDIKNYAGFRLNGMINCQSLRVFFPSGIGMETMGKLLWNKELSFDEIACNYFKASYGDDGTACLEFIEEIQKNMDIDKKMLGKECKAVIEKVGRIRVLIENFKPVIERNLSLKEYCHLRSWHYMEYFIRLVSMYADYLELYSGKDGNISECGKKLSRYLFGIEDDVQKVVEPEQILNDLHIKW